MKVYELLSFNRELLKRFHDMGIKAADYKYIDLYSEYEKLLAQGEKVTYIVLFLADKYKVSERLVYNVVNRMRRDVTLRNLCS